MPRSDLTVPDTVAGKWDPDSSPVTDILGTKFLTLTKLTEVQLTSKACSDVGVDCWIIEIQQARRVQMLVLIAGS